MICGIVEIVAIGGIALLFALSGRHRTWMDARRAVYGSSVTAQWLGMLTRGRRLEPGAVGEEQTDPRYRGRRRDRSGSWGQLFAAPSGRHLAIRTLDGVSLTDLAAVTMACRPLSGLTAADLESAAGLLRDPATSPRARGFLELLTEVLATRLADEVAIAGSAIGAAPAVAIGQATRRARRRRAGSRRREPVLTPEQAARLARRAAAESA